FSYCQTVCSLLTWSSSETRRFGHSTALARSTCLRRGTLNLGVSKYFSSGQKRTVVPDFDFGAGPTSRSFAAFSPPATPIAYPAPPRSTRTSSYFDSALTTLTPTPCRPPEKL